ncbi:MAG TPA: G1 family glutamic endopeptidase [Acidimicrobiales bacterium]|nr:G1 family glutamic endopeptidase [Acidimicrobiales bacterium]
MAVASDGYWLVASDGGIFTFGDAGYYGSTGGITLNKPIVGMAPTPDGKGYWLVASDGGIFTFGDAGYYGSEPGAGVAVDNTVGIAASPSGDGYWMEGSDGRVSAFGDAGPEGSLLGKPLNKPIVGFASVSISQTSPPPPTPPPVTTTPPLTITTTALPNATLGISYSATLTASGGTTPYVWTITSGSLPAGLNLSSNGAITGTSSVSGNSTFAVRVTDAATPTVQTASTSFSIEVSGALLAITTSSLPSATVGTAYSASLTATGGTPPYSWTVTSGSLPTGLSLSSAGAVTGTPSTQGSATFTVEVTDATSPTAQTASAAFSIEVSAPAIPIVESGNWSGYVVGNGPFTGVSGTFNVPYLFAGTPSSDAMSEWVGIGGVGNTPLIQAGVSESPDPSNLSLFYIHPWWEVLPADPLEINITSVLVSAGDEVSVDIGQISGTEWAIELTDDTNGESFTTDQIYTGSGSTAEWIVEAPTANSQVVPLAPYSPVVDFSDLGISPVNTTVEEWEMVQSGSLVSTPSAFTSSGFNVAYGDIAPAAP